jgi:lauroyl/myristoyl acyltransferase
MRSLALRAGLRLADLLARALPRSMAYALADRAGKAWHRRSPARRALVAANLARVCEVTGRPVNGPHFDEMVERSFVEYARYYLELLRAPHYPADRLGEIVRVDHWDRWLPVLRDGCVVASLHLGNFEPFGRLLASAGVPAMAPVEETRPRELYEFLRARRGGGHDVRIVPLAGSRRPMVEALRRGEVVGLIADRDLAGDGQPVSFFAEPATLPTGPAALAMLTGRPLLVAACYRDGPEHFRARVWRIHLDATGDRRADTMAMIEQMGRRFEEAIAAAPEQWFAAFQPYWTDER